MIKDEIKLNTVVDTLEVDMLKDNVANPWVIVADNKGYIKTSGNVKSDDNYFRVKLSPKHLIGYEETNSKKNIEEAINTIADEIGVNVLNIESNRIDISVDSSLKYNDYVKFHLYLFELITFKESSKKKILCTSLDSYKDNNMYFNGRDLKLSIYNKADESDGSHPYETRIEFRWCRYVSLDTEKSAKKVLAKIKDIENNNPELTARLVTKLSARFEEEKASCVVTNFTEFVRKYDKFFYTADIVKGVYEATGLKGSFTNWFKKFKKDYPSFDYYSLSDIKSYRNMMNKSIKNYIKS